MPTQLSEGRVGSTIGKDDAHQQQYYPPELEESHFPSLKNSTQRRLLIAKTFQSQGHRAWHCWRGQYCSEQLVDWASIPRVQHSDSHERNPQGSQNTVKGKQPRTAKTLIPHNSSSSLRCSPLPRVTWPPPLVTNKTYGESPLRQRAPSTQCT